MLSASNDIFFGYVNCLDFCRTAIERNPEYLKKLPKIEQDLYFYYAMKNMNQKEIAKIMGVTQGAISSRLSRLAKRVKFLQRLEEFDLNNFEEKLSLFDAFEIELLRGMLETTCQSETARRLNQLYNLDGASKDSMNQVKVRHRFEKILSKMQKIEHPYYKLFLFIKNNLYMLHQIKLPHFSG